MKKKWTWSKIVLATAAGLLAAVMLSAGSLSIADHKGKPHGKPGGGGEDPTPSPKIKYRIQFYDVPNPSGSKATHDLNNSGQVVGHFTDTDGNRRGFLYDPQVDAEQAVDLNTIVAGVPEDWLIRSATAINSWGDIVGYIDLVGAPTQIVQAVMIDMSASPPALHIIPDAGELEGYTGGFSWSTDMNEFGDIVAQFQKDDGSYGTYIYNFGLYDPLEETLTPTDLNLASAGTSRWPMINNAVQVVGELADGSWYRRTPSQPLETFSFDDWRYGPRGLNDSGTFCGNSWVTAKGNSSHPLPFRYDTEPRYLLDAQWVNVTFLYWKGAAINSSGDLCGHFTGKDRITPWIHHDDWGGINVLDLVTGSPADLDLWNTESESRGGITVRLISINDRDTVTDFGQLSGYLRFDDATIIPFVLTPELAP